MDYEMYLNDALLPRLFSDKHEAFETAVKLLDMYRNDESTDITIAIKPEEAK